LGVKKGELLMVGVTEITLEKLLLFTGRSSTLITIDAPLFSSFMIFKGQVLCKGPSYVEPEKIGNSIGFPSYEQVVAEASRFWLVDDRGVRRRKSRGEMAALLEKSETRMSRIPHVKSAKSV
jgi:hypothetical protein